MSDPHEKLLEDTVRTPAWLPLTGLALFFAAVVYLVLKTEAPDVTLQAPAPAAEPATTAPATD